MLTVESLFYLEHDLRLVRGGFKFVLEQQRHSYSKQKRRDQSVSRGWRF